MPKWKFNIAVCLISFVAIWANYCGVGVFTYSDLWELLLNVLEIVVGGTAFGFCAAWGVELYEKKSRKKIFNDSDKQNNKAA